MSDTGNTFNNTIEWLEKNDITRKHIQKIKTACLWRKKSSSFTPDFCHVHLPNDSWIVQPNEQYDETTIQDIANKYITLNLNYGTI